MKYLIALILLFFSTITYAGDLLAIVNGNKITTDVAHQDFFNMNVDQKKIAIRRLIEKELAIEYALNNDIVKDKKFIDTYNHILEKTQKDTKKDLASAVKNKKQNFSKEQRRSKKGLLAFDMILDNKAAQLNPPKNTLEKYYKINKEKYDTKKMYELLHIVVNKKKQANEILEKIKNSQTPIKTFQKLASEKSLAPSKSKNGYLGQFYYSDMPKEMKEATKNLKTGEYSKPFKTDFGYQIVYVMGYQDQIKRGFKESQINVKQDYTRETVINWAFEQINKLKKDAKIKIVFKG